MLDKNEYQKGIKLTKEEVEELRIIRDEFHGEWNYTFKPKKEEAASFILWRVLSNRISKQSPPKK